MRLDRGDGRAHPGIVSRQELHVWDQQHTRVEGIRSIRLSERAEAWVETVRQDVVPDLLSRRAPALEPRSKPVPQADIELLDQPHGTVERDPRHQLGIREVELPRAADLPDALVGALPVLL